MPGPLPSGGGAWGRASCNAQRVVVVPPGEPGAIARAIELLLADPRRRRQMGTASRQRVLEWFQLPQMVRAWEDLFASLTAAAVQGEEEGRRNHAQDD